MYIVVRLIQLRKVGDQYTELTFSLEVVKVWRRLASSLSSSLTEGLMRGLSLHAQNTLKNNGVSPLQKVVRFITRGLHTLTKAYRKKALKL